MCLVRDSSVINYDCVSILRRGAVISVGLLSFIREAAASHKSNLSALSQGYVEISKLGHVGGGNRCGGATL